MTLRKRILSAALSLVLCLGLLPTAAFAAEEQETTTGISSNTDQTLQALGFVTYADELKAQAEKSDSPYGNGNSAIITWHELLAQGANTSKASIVHEYKSNSFQSPSKRKNVYDDWIEDAIAARSVAFDPFGLGKDNFVATLWAEEDNEGLETEIYLGIWPDNNYQGDVEPYAKKLVTLPFKLYPENAGAYLSITAGNFDGDDMNTDELALYHPFHSTKKDKVFGVDYGSGTIDIYSVYVAENVEQFSINWTFWKKQEKKYADEYAIKRIACYELIDKSDYYFFNNTLIRYMMEKGGDYDDIIYSWIMMYLMPQVGVEAVEQPGSAADDLCITFTAAMGGQKNKDIGVNAKRPYDSATGVFFWIDPATKYDKRTTLQYMRWQWADKYGVPKELDKKAKDKYEIMTFGGAGSGDINNDSYNEVVIAGYRFANSDEIWDGGDNGDWNIAEKEYLATYYTYDPEKNTYNHCGSPANWVAAGKDHYQGAYDQLEGVYHNIGEKDAMHNPLTVECFADRGNGFAEAVAIGGVITYLDANSGVSAYKPDDKKFGGSVFEAGAFNGLYAIPTKGIQETTWGENVENRTFVELVAGNFNGNLLGKEQLAFAYTAKRKNENKYYSAFGLIGQINPGEQAQAKNVKRTTKNWDEKHYINKKGLEFELYNTSGSNGLWRAPVTVSAIDYDNDSYIMRRANRPNQYFFSDPEIIAVLQGAPYFKEVDYGTNNGNTSFKTTQGESVTETHGVYAGLTVQAGYTEGTELGSKKLSANVAAVVGAVLELRNSWGDGTAKYFSLNFESAEEDCVALVMAPCVRYHYDIYNPESKTWDPIEVDVGQTPRASIITVEKYDQVAAAQGWELIRGNILPDNDNDPSTPYVYGDPTAYYQKPLDLANRAVYDKENKDESYFYGATTKGYGSLDDSKVTNYGADDYVKLGVSNGSSITQSITTEMTESTIREWSTGVHGDVEFNVSSFAMNIEAALGYTGSKTWVDFSGTEFAGRVVSVPVGYEDYSFAWRFGYWNDSLMTKSGKKEVTQTFPVLGYLVTDIHKPLPPIADPMLHVRHNGTDGLTLAWKATQGGITTVVENDGFILSRMQYGVYHPLGFFPLTSAANGWQVFTDARVTPFSEYTYALRPYGVMGGEMLYGDYISAITSHTAPNDKNIPKVSVTETAENGQRRLAAEITSATGDVTPVGIQWQQYIPAMGGWVDLPNGFNVTSISIGAQADAGDFRCRVTQMVDTQTYIVYSEACPSGYVFIAGKSQKYTNHSGKTVVDYTLVHEDGSVTVVSSTNTGYNTKYVYALSTDQYGDLLLTLNDNVLQRRSVTDAAEAAVELDGGDQWKSNGGKVLQLNTASRSWDARKLVEQVGTAPLLKDGKTSAQVTKTLPKVTASTLTVDDWISSTASGNYLRTAFVFGEKTWTEPSRDSNPSHSAEYLDGYDSGLYAKTHYGETESVETLYGWFASDYLGRYTEQQLADFRAGFLAGYQAADFDPELLG